MTQGGIQGPKDMGVSKNRGTPKWMVYNGKRKTLLKGVIWGYHYFRKHPYESKGVCVFLTRLSKKTPRRQVVDFGEFFLTRLVGRDVLDFLRRVELASIFGGANPQKSVGDGPTSKVTYRHSWGEV